LFGVIYIFLLFFLYLIINYYRLLKQKLYPKINPANGEEDGKWNPEPLAFMLTYFSGRSQITLDVFGRAVADFF
jgi:hypothetical protein